MRGILIINGFLQSRKFEEIYALLQNAAEAMHIRLEVIRHNELLHNRRAIAGLRTDFVLFWDKDVLLARLLESAGFPVFNAAQAIEDCDNKGRTYVKLALAGLPVPETVLAPMTYDNIGYTDGGFISDAIDVLGFPMVLKELYGSFGQQVYLARNAEELTSIQHRIGSKPFLMQRFIASSFGRDVRVNVVGDRAVAAILRHNEHGDFRSNITNGGTATAHTLSHEQEAVAIAACRALKLDLAGVDLLFGASGEPIVCEVNSNPHFRSTLDCTGIDLAPHILRHIAERLQNA